MPSPAASTAAAFGGPRKTPLHPRRLRPRGPRGPRRGPSRGPPRGGPPQNPRGPPGPPGRLRPGQPGSVAAAASSSSQAWRRLLGRATSAPSRCRAPARCPAPGRASARYSRASGRTTLATLAKLCDNSPLPSLGPVRRFERVKVRGRGLVECVELRGDKRRGGVDGPEAAVRLPVVPLREAEAADAQRVAHHADVARRLALAVGVPERVGFSRATRVLRDGVVSDGGVALDDLAHADALDVVGRRRQARKVGEGAVNVGELDERLRPL
mmetsp:Transcript_16120/g.57341  ORF Transcript_16120/g.57341 Transcript_16120/m.57341 type:complete len:269 (-) Transcript_16120:1183-1989(-)